MPGSENQNDTGRNEGGVVEVGPDALQRSGPLLAALGANPTAERLAAVLGKPGTGVTGTTETIPAPGETGTNITALGTQDGIPSVDGDVEMEIEE